MGVMISSFCERCGRPIHYPQGDPALCAKHALSVPPAACPDRSSLVVTSYREAPTVIPGPIPFWCRVLHRWRLVEIGPLEAWFRYSCRRCGDQKVVRG